MKNTIKRYANGVLFITRRFFIMLFVLGFRAYIKITTPKLPDIQYGSGPENGWHKKLTDKSLVQSFTSTVGATLTTEDDNSTFPHVYKNLSVITAKQITPDSREKIDDIAEYSEWTDDVIKGALIQHEATGQTYLYILGAYILFPVADFECENGLYTNIRVNIFSDDDWKQVPVDFNGTRTGGITNFDVKKWPHYKLKPLKFLGQYQLPDGRYIHMFAHIKSILATEMENGTNCAIVDGGPIPSWIKLRPLRKWNNKNFVCYPEFAFTPVAKKSKIAPTPEWIQEESIPDDPNYRFLLQFGGSTIPAEQRENEFDRLMIGDCGDWYLHYNSVTKEARLQAQFY